MVFTDFLVLLCLSFSLLHISTCLLFVSPSSVTHTSMSSVYFLVSSANFYPCPQSFYVFSDYFHNSPVSFQLSPLYLHQSPAHF